MIQIETNAVFVLVISWVIILYNDRVAFPSFFGKDFDLIVLLEEDRLDNPVCSHGGLLFSHVREEVIPLAVLLIEELRFAASCRRRQLCLIED